jgi:RHS repeat-associated protein
MGKYTEQYVYDAVGNFLEMRHHGSDPAHPGWTRAYAYREPSQLESSKVNNRLTNTQIGSGDLERYDYDVHGSMETMPHLPLMRWDCSNQLIATAQQRVNIGTPEMSYYVYDAGGQRARKVTESQAAAGQTPVRKAERIYLGGFEIYREFNGNGTAVTLERETLHIMDDQQRIALVEIRIQGNDSGAPQLLRYQLGNHLGSATLELDDQAQIVSYEEYYPYGSSSYQAVRSQTEVPKRYRYTGKERDAENGLNYHGARYYAAWIGQWVAADPIGLEAGVNVFVYCDGNPVNKIDNSGTDWCWNPFAGDCQVVIHKVPGWVAEGAWDATVATGESIGEWSARGYLAIAGDDAQKEHVKSDVSAKANAVWAAAKDPLGTAKNIGRGAWETVKDPENLSRAVGATLAPGIPGSKLLRGSKARKALDKTPHVGASPKAPKRQKSKLTVNDAGKDKCVGAVCAIMKNQESRDSPATGYTVKDLEQEFQINFGRLKGGEANRLVATPERAVPTIEKITGMRAINRTNPVNFAEAAAEGVYAIFLNEAHVIYARIGPGRKVSILDATVGRGWSSWDDFLRYAKRDPSLYGANPAKSNKAFRFAKEPKEP